MSDDSLLQNYDPSRTTDVEGPIPLHEIHNKRETVKKKNKFALWVFIESLNLEDYQRMTEEDRIEYLEKINAMDLFMAIEELNRKIADLKTENYYLNEILVENDPKWLASKRFTQDTAKFNLSIDNSSTLSSTTISSSVAKIRKTECFLNYRAKTSLAERSRALVEEQIIEAEKIARKQIVYQSAEIEELRLTYNDTSQTIKNFHIHFLHDKVDLEFLAKATEKELDNKIRKFLNTWLKKARTIASILRLSLIALQDTTHVQRAKLVTQKGLSMFLKPVDFRLIRIKRKDLLHILDDQNAQLGGLKRIAGRAAVALAATKQHLQSVEKEAKSLLFGIAEATKNMDNLKREKKLIESQNAKASKALEDLKREMSIYTAPSVNEYVSAKIALDQAMKEEKMYQRKLKILEMKFGNLLRISKHMQRNSYIKSIHSVYT